MQSCRWRMLASAAHHGMHCDRLQPWRRNHSLKRRDSCAQRWRCAVWLNLVLCATPDNVLPLWKHTHTHTHRHTDTHRQTSIERQAGRQRERQQGEEKESSGPREGSTCVGLWDCLDISLNGSAWEKRRKRKNPPSMLWLQPAAESRPAPTFT